MGIKEAIRRSEKLYYIARILQQSGSKDFRRRVTDISDSWSAIRIDSLGELNEETFFYLIDIDDLDAHSGFFALLNGTVNRLELARRTGAVPFVRWINTSYSDIPDENTFEKYFIQNTKVSYDEILHSANVAISRPQDGFPRDYSSIYSVNADSVQYDGYINRMGYLYARYIRLRPEYAGMIEDELEKEGMINLTNTIGVHFRGADYMQALKGHPKYVAYDEYKEAVDMIMSESGYKDILLCTDDENAVEYFNGKFGNVLYFHNTRRTAGDVGVHYMNSREHFDSDIGYEVIRDVYALSRCGALASGVSNVSFAARALKASGAGGYGYCRILGHGTNKRGITSKEFNERFKRRSS